MSYLEKYMSNNDQDFIPAPVGTEPFPFTKKIRGIAKRYDTLIVSIPIEICHLLQLSRGDQLKVYCDIENGRIVMDKIPE
ncbi:MAG: hypothetical protein L0H53_03525 [Candidatus Nitrosocosmicus sp.]|nr:hypothetical protein [Candidatus Nitrosocosmicus sp.]MDN5865941.1 hypothetical protein [Candidatus Nitrosocosmicus sp.]